MVKNKLRNKFYVGKIFPNRKNKIIKRRIYGMRKKILEEKKSLLSGIRYRIRFKKISKTKICSSRFLFLQNSDTPIVLGLYDASI